MTKGFPAILCGVDGSESSLRALRVGHVLADALRGPLVLAHVAHDHDVDASRDLIARAAAGAGAAPFVARPVRDRSPTRGLLATAQIEQAALIVVGASGHSAVHDAVLGSVAAQLPLEAACPVVVTPQNARIPGASEPAMGPRCIVCGIDDSDEARTATRVAGRFARALGARLVLTHVRLPQPLAVGPALSRHSVAVVDEVAERRAHEASVDLIERAADWTGFGRAFVDPAMEVGDPCEQIEAVAEREDADLIVVGSRGRGLVRAAVLGSTSHDLTAQARRPVVIVGPNVRP